MEKELLSVFETSQHYPHILLGSQCRFFCDHKNLGLHHFKSDRVKRWRSTLEEFDYTFEYCPGKENTIANMLSRYPMVTVTTKSYEEVTTMEEFVFPASTSKISASQTLLPDLHDKAKSFDYYNTIYNDGIPIIHQKGKIVVGAALFQEILEWYHINLNHPGQDRTHKIIAAVFYTKTWKGKYETMSTNAKYARNQKSLQKSTALPWEVIQIDLFGPWTFTNIDGIPRHIQGLSIIDVATCWTELCPYVSKRSDNIALLVDQQ